MEVTSVAVFMLDGGAGWISAEADATCAKAFSLGTAAHLFSAGVCSVQPGIRVIFAGMRSIFTGVRAVATDRWRFLDGVHGRTAGIAWIISAGGRFAAGD